MSTPYFSILLMSRTTSDILKTLDTRLEVADYINNNIMISREKVGQANVYNIKRKKKRWSLEKRHN